jgi:hypothetical protein
MLVGLVFIDAVEVRLLSSFKFLSYLADSISEGVHWRFGCTLSPRFYPTSFVKRP